MKPSVFVRHKNEEPIAWRRTSIRELWRRQSSAPSALADESTVGGEKYLENFIVARPELLGFENDDEESNVRGPFRCFAQRTVTAPNGRSIFPDIVILAGSGDVIVVEVKLGDNPELKDRQVVAQVLEYAASLTKCDEKLLVTMFGDSPAKTWPDTVRALFPEHADPIRLANQFAAKFRDADLHLVIACDEVPTGLAELVQGVVSQQALGAFQFRVVEIAPFTSESGDDVLFLPAMRLRTVIVQRIMVAVRTEGEQHSLAVSVTPFAEAEAKARTARESAAGLKWNEQRFFEIAKSTASKEAVEGMRRALSYGLEAGAGTSVEWGAGVETGGFRVRAGSGTIFYCWSDGELTLYVEKARKQIGTDLTAKVFSDLAAILGVTIPLEDACPKVRADLLADDLRFEKFRGWAEGLRKLLVKDES